MEIKINTNQKIIKPKLGLLALAKQLGNISYQHAKQWGYSQDRYYRFKELYDKGGELALLEVICKKPIFSNHVDF